MVCICVECGKGNAKEGSMKQPYCKACFKRVWNSNYKKYCWEVLAI